MAQKKNRLQLLVVKLFILLSLNAFGDDRRCFKTVYVPKYQVSVVASVKATAVNSLPDGTVLTSFEASGGQAAYDSKGTPVPFPAWIDQLGRGNPTANREYACNDGAVHVLRNGNILDGESRVNSLRYLHPDGSVASVVNLPSNGGHLGIEAKDGTAILFEGTLDSHGHNSTTYFLIVYPDGKVNGPYNYQQEALRRPLDDVVFLSDGTVAIGLPGHVEYVTHDGVVSDLHLGGLGGAVTPKGLAVLGDDSLVFGGTDNNIHFLSLDGSQRIYSPAAVSADFSRPAVEGDGTVVIADLSGSNVQLIHPDGSVKTAYAIPYGGAVGFDPIVMKDNTILVSNPEGLAFLDPDGTLKAYYPSPSGTTIYKPPFVADDGIVQIQLLGNGTLEFLKLDQILGLAEKRRVQVPCP